MRKFLAIAAFALMFAGTTTAALAASCPREMKAVDAALAAQPDLSAAQLDEVKKLRAEGEALHKAGSHSASVRALGQAQKILGI